MTQETLQKWLEERGICLETASRFGIEAYLKGGKVWAKIPFVKDGMVVNNKHRCITEKAFTQDEGGLKCFWNEDVLFDESLANEPVIITEGELDAIAAVQCGFVRTISVPDGAPAKPILHGESAKYSYLTDLVITALRKAPCVILAVDGDQVGANLLQDLSIRIGREVCKWVKYPQGCKDLNDALKAYGHRGVQETLARAGWIRMEGVYKMSELPPIPQRPIYNVGFTGLDDFIKVRLGDFMVITGIPSHGKSTFVNDLCCRLAVNHGLKTTFASFEQEPQSDHLDALRVWHIGRKSPWTLAETNRADKWIDEVFSFIYPNEFQLDNETININWVFEKAAAAVKRHGANIVVIDPWNEIEHTRPRNMSMTDYVTWAIMKFRQFARTYNVFLIIVAHPTKLKKEINGKFPIPTLYDIADSAAWYNKPDLGVVVYKEANEEQVDQKSIISIQKVRKIGTIGKQGSVELYYSNETNRFNSY